MALYARILENTIPHFEKGFLDEVKENSMVLKILDSKGRIKTGAKGTQYEWRVKRKQHPLKVLTDGGVDTVQRRNTYITAVLPWKGYSTDNMITEFEQKVNSGDSALWSQMGKMLAEMQGDMKDELNKEFYKDGLATGNEGRIHGFETIAQDNTLDSDKAVGRHQTFIDDSQDDTDYLDSKTYAGLNLNSSGEDIKYWSPILVNTDSTSGSNIFTSLATKPLEILDFMMTELRNNSNTNEWPDCCLVDPATENIIRAKLIGNQTIYVGWGDPTPKITDSGLRAIHFNGVPIYADVDALQGVTVNNVLYMFNSKHLAYRVLGSKFINVHRQPDIDNVSEKFKITHYGQLQISSPRHFVKAADFNLT